MSLASPISKMSKSDPNPLSRILLTDTPSTIRANILSALTDSTNSVSYDPVSRPGVSNLLELYSYFDAAKRSPAALAEACNGMTLKVFKTTLAETIAEGLRPARERYERIMGEDDGKYLEHIRDVGGKKARESAEPTMVEVRKAMGFWR